MSTRATSEMQCPISPTRRRHEVYNSLDEKAIWLPTAIIGEYANKL